MRHIAIGKLKDTHEALERRSASIVISQEARA